MANKRRVWNMEEVYDSSDGTFVRKTRPTEISNITYYGTSTACVSTVISASYDYYPYLFRVGCSSTLSIFSLMANTTTLALIDLRTSGICPQILSDPDVNPIAKISAGSTLKIKVPLPVANATYTANLICKKVPINSKINT